MNLRSVCSLRAAITAAMPAVMAVAFLTASASAQTSSTPKTKPAESSSIPRTADGHPDLSGVYSNATAVPIARPANCGDREFYTPEEAAAGARDCGGAARGGAGRGRGAAGAGGRGAGGRGAAAGRGAGAAAAGDGEGGLQVHYDMAQFGLDAAHTVRAKSLRTSIITGPEGRVPPLTPEAQQRQKDLRAFNAQHQWDGPEYRSLSERCIMWGNEGPPFFPTGYDSDLQIAQGEGYVVVDLETIHDARIIPTDGRPHLPPNVHQLLGDPRGHWEGDTLVVETTNFTTRTSIQGAPTTDKLKVTERFSRLDANNVLYQFTVDDPGTWTKPWSGEEIMTKLDTPLYEYACHEGNYGMPNILSGHLAAEQ